MPLLRRIARPLLAGIFIHGGIAALRDPKGYADVAAPVLDKAAPMLDKVTQVAPLEQPPSNVTLVQIDAGVKIGAGLLLATGKAPRVASAALAASLVPTTLAGHRFWELDDPQARANHQTQFMKNLGLLGGLLLASADTHGKPSLAWRARRARRTSAATAELLHRDITAGAGQLTERASRVTSELAGKLGGQASDVAGKLGGQASDVAGKLGGQASEVAAKVGSQASEAAGRWGGQASEAAAKAGDRIAPVATRAGDRLAPVAERLVGQTDRWRDEAGTLSARAAKKARKAAKKARKRTAKQVDQASKRASAQLEYASKRASKELDRASKRTAKKLRKASARAHQVRSSVESKLG